MFLFILNDHGHFRDKQTIDLSKLVLVCYWLKGEDREVKGIMAQQNPHFLPSPLHEYSPLLALTELLILWLSLASQQFKNIWTAVFDIAYPKYRLKYLRWHFHLNPGIDLSWDSTYHETLAVIYTKFKAFGTGLKKYIRWPTHAMRL